MFFLFLEMDFEDYRPFDDLSGFSEVHDSGVRELNWMNSSDRGFIVFSRIPSLDRVRGFLYDTDPRIALLINDRAEVDSKYGESPDANAVEWHPHARAAWLYSATFDRSVPASERNLFTISDGALRRFKINEGGYTSPCQGAFFELVHEGGYQISYLIGAHKKNSGKILENSQVVRGEALVDLAVQCHDFIRKISPVSNVA